MYQSCPMGNVTAERTDRSSLRCVCCWLNEDLRVVLVYSNSWSDLKYIRYGLCVVSGFMWG